MESPYKTKYYFYLHGIPFLPLALRGRAVNCRIGESKQLVFIPASYFDITTDYIKVKPKVDLEWFYNKPDTQSKIKHYFEENNVTQIKPITLEEIGAYKTNSYMFDDYNY